MARPSKYNPWTYIVGIGLAALAMMLDSCGLINISS